MFIPYWTQDCPECGATVDGGLGVTPISRLGHEFAICPKKKCSALYVTGANEWNHMTRQQKFWYLCSLLVMGTVVVGGIGYVWAGDRMYLNGGAIILTALATVKTLRIMLSRRRCPEGRQEATLLLHPFPAVAVTLCGSAGAMTWVVVAILYPERMWLAYAGAGAALLGAIGFTAAWLNKVTSEETPVPDGTAEVAALLPPTPENPWSEKDGS